MERSLAWREGQIALDGDTLGEAVEEFNRYNHRQLVVANPELAQAKLVGWFWLDDPDSFAGAAARTLGAEIKLRDNQIVLISRR
jgi:transmembrane sensor